MHTHFDNTGVICITVLTAYFTGRILVWDTIPNNRVGGGD